jgi:hypothetical protein
MVGGKTGAAGKAFMARGSFGVWRDCDRSRNKHHFDEITTEGSRRGRIAITALILRNWRSGVRDRFIIIVIFVRFISCQPQLLTFR